MAVNGTTNSTSQTAYSYLQYKNKISGLVSGMDIDSIMEKLMKAESAQMEKLQQQKQKYEWTRDAYREVNTTLTSFQEGLFDDYGKNSNWNAKTVNVSNTTAVSVVAGANARGNLSITGSKQATAAKSEVFDSSTIAQTRVTEDTTLSSISSIGANSELKLFGQTLDSDDTSLKNVIEVLDAKGYKASISNGRFNISAKENATEIDPDTITSLSKLGINTTTNQKSSQLKTSDDEVATTTTTLSAIGVSENGTMKLNVGGEEIEVAYTKDETLSSLMKKITSATGLSASLKDGVITLASSDKKAISITDSPISFSENTIGLATQQKSDAIKIDDKAITTSTKLSALGLMDGAMSITVGDVTTTIDYKADDNVATLLSNIQKQTGINASLDKDGAIVLASDTTKPITVNNSPFIFDNGTKFGSLTGDTLYSSDSSGSTLTGTNTVGELLGSAATDTATTNKFTLSAMKEDGTMKETTIEFKNTDTIDTIVSKINSSSAGVTAIFNNGKLSISANNTGEREDGGAEVSLLVDKNIGQSTALFNALGVDTSNTVNGGVALADGGQNALLTVNDITYEQQSNVFNVAGYTITTTGNLGDYTDGEISTSGNTVTVNSTTNTDDIINKVKEFVNTYNGLIKDLNTKVTEKKNVDYAPLTDAQKAEMTEDEIRKWEEKSKAGLLKGDSNINTALSTMRSALSQYGSTTGDTLYSIGISTSSTWSDNGKLEINEDKLRAALEKDPDIVSRIFTGDSTNGQEGVVSKLRTAAQTAVKNIEVTAGKATSTSEKSYSLGRTISDLGTKIDDWKDRLKDIEERYWNQFSAMEQAIQKANSQSSIFSSGS